ARALRPRALIDFAEHLIPSQVFHDQASQRGSGITDDLVGCGSCGIPAAWRSPTTRRPRGSPRRNRCVRHVALPLGCRVVALGEAGGMPHPVRPGPAAAILVPGPSRKPARPARAWFSRAALRLLM